MLRKYNVGKYKYRCFQDDGISFSYNVTYFDKPKQLVLEDKEVAKVNPNVDKNKYLSLVVILGFIIGGLVSYIYLQA
jgi:hypothetical protein